MSEMQFIELGSTDPVERAIARKVVRILNDRTLDRQQREALVRRAQEELRRHQAQRWASPGPKARQGRRRVPELDPIALRRRELGRDAPPAAPQRIINKRKENA